MSEEGKDSKSKKKSSYKSKKKFQREFLPPAKQRVDPDDLLNYPELIVAGHKVTPREADIFYKFHTCHDQSLICKEFGMTPQNLWQMQQRSWWQAWSLNQLKSWMDEARNQWLANGRKLVKAQSDFIDDPDAFPQGYGQAIAKMMDSYFRASPEGIRPTLVSKFEHEYQADIKLTVDNKVTITPEAIKGLSAEQIDEWNRTGITPQELTEIKENDTAKENAVEIEFEEVEEDEEEEDEDK